MKRRTGSPAASDREASRGIPARVGVIGAGLSGLRAATELVRHGFDVTVFEAREQVGGRAIGEWCAGHWMDAAWPVLAGRDGSLAGWARQVGAADSLLPLRPVQPMLYRGGQTTPVDGLNLRGAARIPGPPLWERPKLLRWRRLMARYAKQLDPMFPELAADLDYRSVRDHVVLYFGRGALESWLTPEIQGIHGDSVEELSRVALLLQVRTLGLGERRPATPGLPRRPLLELAQAAAEGLSIRRATRVSRIDEEAGGGFRLEANDARGERSEACFDAVVVATGPSGAAGLTRALQTPAERDFFARVQERTVMTLSVALEGVDGGLPREIRIPRREGSALASLVVEPGQPGGRVIEGHSQIVALARDVFAERWSSMADDVVEKNLLGSLERVLPGTGERMLTSRLGRSSVPFFGVGAYRRLATFQKVQRDRRALGRRLYWAGDHLAGPGFEAASLSGLRAARALAMDLARA
ncbi:MAG TPA: FAD-dependent oxidoreductase [Deltaproteobacteria bacterium]|nr:FAD-dependent oxidoreductase [Deltaproteobacteria bacterium]